MTLSSTQLHDEEYATDPLNVWRVLRDEHPVFYDSIDEVFVLSRYDDVRWAFTSPESLSNRVYARTVGKVFGASMLQMDGRGHVDRRKVVAPQFVGRRLGRFDSVVRSAALEVINGVRDRDEFDLVADVAHRMPGMVMATLLGLPPTDLDDFFGWYNAMMAGLWTDPELRRRGHLAHLEFQRYLEPILKHRRRNPGDDLISRLIVAEVDGKQLDADDLGSFISLLLVAGGETTDKAIANLLWCLLGEGDVPSHARTGRRELDRALTETLRLFPSLMYLGREATCDISVGGVPIPAGSVVRLNVGSAHRDERVFDNPDQFHPDRHDLHLGRELRGAPLIQGRASHLAFGAGPHFCIGYQLARLEAVEIAHALFDQLGGGLKVVDSSPPRTVPPSRVVQRLVVTSRNC
jgi:cytochrome P450